MTMTILLATLALAQPVERRTIDVQTLTPNALLKVVIQEDELDLFVTRGFDALSCGEGSGVTPLKYWAFHTRKIREAVAGVEQYEEADWGKAKSGGYAEISASGMQGYCNTHITTQSSARGGPRVNVTFAVNRACFGSAGCNRDIVTVALSPGEALRLADRIDYHLDQNGIDPARVKASAYTSNAVLWGSMLAFLAASTAAALWLTSP